VPSAALVVRRSALEDGCFDERLLAAEDVDLVWRLAEAGWTIRYEPRAEVGHDQRPGPVAMLRQRSSYGATAGPLGRRHPTEIAPVAAAPMTLVAGALLAGRRPWLALGVAAAGTVSLRRASAVGPHTAGVRLATEGTTRGALPFLAGCFRAYGPLLVAGAVASRRLRAPALVIAVAPALGAWSASARELDPARYVLATWPRTSPTASGCGGGPRRPHRRTPRASTHPPAPHAGRHSGAEVDHAADVGAGLEVVVAVLHLVERVLLGDQLVDLELAGLVEAEQVRDLHRGLTEPKTVPSSDWFDIESMNRSGSRRFGGRARWPSPRYASPCRRGRPLGPPGRR